MPQLFVPGPAFYSRKDEALFFAWLESIPGVLRVVGEHRSVLVTLRGSRLSKPALLELLALHFRYNIPMQALGQFETPQNTSWFRNRKGFWHKGVFGGRRVKL